jgi:hypothetical protein
MNITAIWLAIYKNDDKGKKASISMIIIMSSSFKKAKTTRRKTGHNHKSRGKAYDARRASEEGNLHFEKQENTNGTTRL